MKDRKRASKKPAKPKELKPDPQWLLVQKVAAMLEKAIDPNAQVLHDQWLPNITTGHKRQCDVIIKYGKPPRQLLALVEVQKRKSKVSIGTLGGWVVKKEEVGAQLLICVSALDYPKSVKAAVAQKYGPRVLLFTLRELQQGVMPPLLVNSITFRLPRAKIVGPVGILYGAGTLGAGSETKRSEQKIFKEGCDDPCTVEALVEEHINRLNRPLGLRGRAIAPF